MSKEIIDKIERIEDDLQQLTELVSFDNMHLATAMALKIESDCKALVRMMWRG